MLTHIRLENFKSWRELDIDLAPITLLYGTNSSGKSSVLQAALFLAQSAYNQHIGDVNFGGNPGDFVDLGSFRDVVFRHDLSLRVLIELTRDAAVWHSAKFDLHYLDGRVVDAEITLSATDVIYDAYISSNQLHYLGPLRSHPKRAYVWTGTLPLRDSPSGEHTVGILIASAKDEDRTVLSEVSNWLSKLGLVNQFQIVALDRDERFFETSVSVGQTPSSLLDVGFGVSQVLPVITSLFFVPVGSIVLLEQPELHLHPRAQAVLADLFLHVAEARNLQLIIESHSEHLLRRIQRRIAEPEYAFATPDNIKAYFCDKGDNGSTIQQVEIDAYGQINNWPQDFFGDILGDLDALTDAAIARRRQELLNGA
jgi:predicted ATPase